MGEYCSIRKNSSNIEKMRLSGMDQGVFDSYCKQFENVHGRLPHLDEIPGASSEAALRSTLGIKKDEDSMPMEKFKERTNSNTVTEGVRSINKTHEDLSVDADIESGKVKLDIRRRPSEYVNSRKDYKRVDMDDNKYSDVLHETCENIQRKYGINVHFCTTRTIAMMGLSDSIFCKGFIKDGEIYINSDKATVDTPMHELIHLIIGTVKAHDIDLYERMTDFMSSNVDMEYLRIEHPNRSDRDLKEECFVCEMAKFICGINSMVYDIERNTQGELLYMFSRAMDTIIDGDVSVRCGDFMGMLEEGYTMKQIADVFHGRMFDGNSSPVLVESSEETMINRTNQNIIEELIKEGRLNQYCE